MPLWEIQKRLAAAPGTRLDLEVLSGGQTKELTLELALFAPPQANVQSLQGASLLRLPSLEPEQLERVAGLVSELEDTPLLVDLRGVAWGEPETAYAVGELFVQGELGQLLGRDGPVKSFSGEDDVWQGKLVVLVDRGTQGAAEILARVLQQGAGAKVVGQPSFGFAGHSRFIELDAGGSLVVTEGFYTGPDGEPLNQGIVPDLRVSERGRAFAEREDAIEDLTLEKALELLRDEVDEEIDEAA